MAAIFGEVLGGERIVCIGGGKMRENLFKCGNLLAVISAGETHS